MTLILSYRKQEEKGGLATQKKAKLKPGLSKDKGIKQNKTKDIIEKNN